MTIEEIIERREYLRQLLKNDPAQYALMSHQDAIIYYNHPQIAFRNLKDIENTEYNKIIEKYGESINDVSIDDLVKLVNLKRSEWINNIQERV